MRISAWIALLSLPCALLAQRNLSADMPMEFDGKTNSVVATQNATFVDKDMTLIADQIKYSKNSQEALASGNVRMNYKGSRLVAKKVTYNVGKHSFVAEDFRLGYFPVMIAGQKIDGTPNKFVLHNATFYTSQTGTLAPNIFAARTEVKPDESAARLNMLVGFLKVGPLPILPIPFASLKVGYDQPLNLRMTAGYSKTYGAYVRSESLYPILKNLSIGANLDYYSARGWLVGPRYLFKTANIDSYLSIGYISDHGKTGVDSRNIGIGDDRGFVDFRHKQQLGQLELSAQTQYWSDSEVVRDFRSRLYGQEQAPESFAELMLPLPDTYISAFTRYDPNNFEAVPEKLPEIRLDRLSTQLGHTGIYWSSNNSLAHMEEGSLDYNRYDGIFTLNRPTAITPWWQFNPIASTRFTYYDRTLPTSTDSSASRLLGEFGFDSQWSFHHIYNVKNETWNIDGLKHTIQPIVQYRYLPHAQGGANSIPVIEGKVFDTNLRPTDFFYMADVDSLSSLNLIRLGLKQNLSTRNTNSKEFPSRELLNFEVYQDYNMATSAGHPRWDSFYMMAEAHPNDWISVGAFTRNSWQNLTWQEHRLFTTLKDGDYQSITLSTRYLQNGGLNQYGVLYQRKLTDNLSLFVDTTFDTQIHDFSQLFTGFNQRLRSGWEVIYGFERRVNDAREDNNSVSVRFRWASF